ncbi:expressed unknown protein [Seminavis robusta]|uniref:Uncharacterized protein n=1 Tax=Seminavis robusta TaxID=568900 RepID=A0A9N8HFH1_9STRA|nr:expressed unknown protein [Seminavis robusta]|eukprot:Sro524_g159870.1 n/a (182) ;mRNA; f:2203-2748
MPTTAKRHMSLDTATTMMEDGSNCLPELKRRNSERVPSLLRRKRVSFHTVDVCEHAITLGDNVVSEGAPLTIEWEAMHSSVHSVDEFELSRAPSYQTNQKPRRLTAEERFCLLSLNGIPMRTSLVAAAEATEARILRQESVQEVMQEQLQQQEGQNNKQASTTKKNLFRKPKALWSKLRAR